MPNNWHRSHAMFSLPNFTESRSLKTLVFLTTLGIKYIFLLTLKKIGDIVLTVELLKQTPQREVVYLRAC